MAHYVRVRHEYLISPSHSSTAQARTVLVTGIPLEYLTESSLTDLFCHLPGGVHKVWINRDLGDMPDLYKKRLKACRMLESAATSFLNKAIKRNRKRPPSPYKDGRNVESNADLTGDFVSDPDAGDVYIEELASEYERPSHWIPPFSWIPFSIPRLGRKVDTIEWACKQIHDLNDKLTERRKDLAGNIAAVGEQTSRTHDIGANKSTTNKYPPTDGAFILFNRQIAAHMAAQTLTHHEPYCMPNSLKYVEATPEDVIWKNLALNPYRRRLRVILSRFVGIVLVIGWMIPGKHHLNLAQQTSRAKGYI